MQLMFDMRNETPESLAGNTTYGVSPFKAQLLKWVGNKQRMATEIIRYFPDKFGVYREPFLGAGGVLGVLSPRSAIASDTFGPLIGIWQTLRENPETLVSWYADRHAEMTRMGKLNGYEYIKARYNAEANSADLLFLSRSCYGGVVRFRMKDGYMSTPCGAHEPISPSVFASRVSEWNRRVQGTQFFHMPFEKSMDEAEKGDMIYCDPPYTFSQAILYGAQKFSLEELFEKIAFCASRGVYVALSIDGSKKSGDEICDVQIPKSLFVREVGVRVGRSMLRRFQMEGRTLENEVVRDRLLLTY